MAGVPVGSKRCYYTVSPPMAPMGSLQKLYLNGNQIGGAGMAAFAEALKPNPSGALATLTRLDLRYNQIGDEGMKVFSTALSSGALGSLTLLGLDGNHIGDAGMTAFADAIKPTDEIPMAPLDKAAENAFMPSSPIWFLKRYSV